MHALKSAAVDPILDAIARAPVVRALSAEQHAELAQDCTDIAEGRAHVVAHADVPHALEEMSRAR
ncbi:MAG: hypothetical protein R3B70_37555 [Polyangiaceae bacterium]